VVSHCTSTGAAVTVLMPASMASTASAPDPRRIERKGKSFLSAARHLWAEIRWQDWRRGGLDTPCAYPHTPVTAEALRPGAQSKPFEDGTSPDASSVPSSPAPAPAPVRCDADIGGTPMRVPMSPLRFLVGNPS
jgi:hypothetical protein